MSTDTYPEAGPKKYTQGDDRYIRFAEDFLGKRLAGTQKRILRAVAKYQRVLIISGNGVGKSYGVAILADAFVATNADSTSLGTSGSYSQFVDTMWRPMKSMAKTLRDEMQIPMHIYEGNQPKLEIDDDWYFKVVSPRDPGDLEGRHASDALVIIEESDKEYITEDHFDSANSTITDANDRMVAIANPPKDEANVVYDKKRSDRWHVIQFSSFESHNVRVDLGEIDDERLPGLVDLPTIADDWEAWNNEPWPKAEETYERHFGGNYPGVDTLTRCVEEGELTREDLIKVLRPGGDIARYAHEHRDDLDIRWYRRRAGVIPPDDASSFRPFTVEQVEDAYDREAERVTQNAQGVGYDVARDGGDFNVMGGKFADQVSIVDRWKGVDHRANEKMVRQYTADWTEATMSIDAQGEGSGVADYLMSADPEVIRFHSGEEAAEGERFYDRWTEGLYKLGRFLRDGGSFNHDLLREELLVTARHVEFEERFYDSRDATVLKATSKDKVKEELGRSPDLLDAVMMAVWSASDAPKKDRNKQRLTW